MNPRLLLTRPTATKLRLVGGSLIACSLIFDKAVGVTQRTAGSTGHFPVFCNPVFSAAILFWIQTREGHFSIIPFWGTTFVTTIGNLLTAANLGRVFQGQAVAISSGLQLIRPQGRVTDSNTSSGRTSFPVLPENLAVLPTAA